MLQSNDGEEMRAGLPGVFARVRDSDIAYAFWRSPMALASALALNLMLVLAAMAPWIAPQNPFDPAALDLMNGKTPPMAPNAFTGSHFILGTDDQGRDLLSAILYGARISIVVGFASVLLSVAIGVLLGLIAGYRGGVLDAIVMRLADIQLTFPSLLVALMISGVAKSLMPPQMHGAT